MEMIYHFYDTILIRKIAEKLKKLPKILLKPYNAYRAIDSFIDSTSRDFAVEVSRR
jgi:hypothetical protein